MYLDPGFGSMLIQLLLGFLAAGGVVLFGFRKKIASLFKKSKNQGIESDVVSNDDDFYVVDDETESKSDEVINEEQR